MTMKITVSGYHSLDSIIGGSRDIQVTEANWTLNDLLRYLSSLHGEDFRQAVFDTQTSALGSYVKIMVNGRHYNHLPLRLDTELRDGDQVSLFPGAPVDVFAKGRMQGSSSPAQKRDDK